MGRKSEDFAVVDLFAGPGGLAEGFSSVVAQDGSKPFRIVLSVEKEAVAHSTLLLRSFLRQFKGGFPPEYYNFLNTGTTEPDWNALYPQEWEAAKRHALLLELGKPATTRLLNTRIDEIRSAYGSNTILIGGPPCQAYSLVGRARNRGVDGYVAEKDLKHFLYEQYIHILERLQPAVFIMENVTGMLSSSVNKKGIFAKVLADLRSAGTSGDYRLVSLAPPDDKRLKSPDAEPRPKDFILCAEEFGLPQSRHRVIVTGLRSDLSSLSQKQLTGCLLKPSPQKVNIEDVLDGMARLRSGLSHDDSPGLWAEKIKSEVKTVSLALNAFPPAERRLLKERLEECAMALQNESSSLPRSASRPNKLGLNCPAALRQWLLDPQLKALRNHETRGHMASDLGRYLFAAIYAGLKGATPKAGDFPDVLAPDHKNWTSGNFNDRFRVQIEGQPSTTITCHISKDGHYFIHPDPKQCRSLTVREAARLQTFPDNYFFKGNRTQQFIQVGNAVPPFLAKQIGEAVLRLIKVDRSAGEQESKGFGRSCTRDGVPKRLAAKEGGREDVLELLTSTG
jgi:DNA (cytosine-5)-methyltransferase 1